MKNIDPNHSNTDSEGEPQAHNLKQLEGVSGNESILRAVLENVAGSICMTDTRGYLIAFNRQFAEKYKILSGLEPATGVEAYGFLPPDKKKHRDEQIQRVLRGEKMVFEPSYVINGQKMVFRTSLNPVFTDGQVTGITSYSVDITREKEAEEELRREKELSDTLINSLPGVFYLVNEEQRFLRWNRNLEVISGYDSGELEQLSALQFYDEATRPLVRQAIDKVFNDGYAEVEEEVVIKSGKKLFFYLNGRRMNYDGKPCLVGVGVDTTDQRKARQEILKSEHRYRTLFEQASDAIMTTDFNGNFIEVNDSLCSMFGYSREELLTMNINALIEPEQLRVRPIDYPRLHIGTQLFTERRMMRRDGTIIEVEANVKKVEDDRVLAIARDVTKLRQAQQLVQLSEARFRGAFEHSAIGMALVSTDGKWLKVNKELCKIVGYTEEELLATTFQQITHPDDLSSDLNLMNRCLTGEIETYRMEKRYFHKDGHTIWINLNVSLVTGKDAKPLYFISQIDDITQRKRAEEEVQALNESLERKVHERTVELEEANRELEAFNYTVSHDLQSPLRVANGFATLLQKEYNNQLTPDAKELLKTIASSLMRMRQLTHDLLDFAKQGKAPLNKRPVDMQHTVAELLQEIKADQQNCRAGIKLGQLKPAYADANLIRQVWMNLVLNAIKYSAKGEHPQVLINSYQNTGEPTVYYVRDNGVGFDMKGAAKLFSAFQRMHSPEEFEGSGIGLATVHRIIARHGGKIWAESKPGEGATFYFTLPGRG